MQNGAAFGLPKDQVTDGFKEVYHRWKTGEMTAVKAMQEVGLKKKTFYKSVREYEEGVQK
ncbi:hypothetical protein [Halalkalibacter flavus]|uniref:hypothetical protein n=1 Tax=Halalkalibacter flavus TaxID=3090668 RepID=UPI002FCA2524